MESSLTNPVHQPAMVAETLEHLGNPVGKRILDMTVGSGGHALALIQAGAFVIGMDCDPEALAVAAERLAEFEHRHMLLEGRMSEAAETLADEGIDAVDGCLIDAGLSMDQMLNQERGFSAHSTSSLDMRLNRSEPATLTALDVVNRYLDKDLRRVFSLIGKRREAHRVAARIVAARKHEPIETTAQLAELIAATIVRDRRARRIDAAPYLMAIRVEVNDELTDLQAGIETACRLLSPTGRLVTLTWDSSEHRMSRRTLRRLADPCVCPPALPCVCGAVATVRLLTRKGLAASAEEVAANPACRSVRLHAAEKLEVAEQ